MKPPKCWWCQDGKQKRPGRRLTIDEIRANTVLYVDWLLSGGWAAEVKWVDCSWCCGTGRAWPWKRRKCSGVQVNRQRTSTTR